MLIDICDIGIYVQGMLPPKWQIQTLKSHSSYELIEINIKIAIDRQVSATDLCRFFPLVQVQHLLFKSPYKQYGQDSHIVIELMIQGSEEQILERLREAILAIVDSDFYRTFEGTSV